MNSDKNFPKLTSIIIGTSDIQTAKKFYIPVFGLIVEREEPHYLSARGIDGTHIEIEEYSEHRFSNWKEHNIGTYKNSEFVVNDINSFFENIVRNGGKVITKPVARPWGGFAGEMADPEGNIFLISQI